MLNKLKKVKGFTLIELIIVIAIIAILAAIAVPAFGQIRQKANVSADMGNARTIYSVVAAEVADESIILPAGEVDTYYALDSIGVGIAGTGSTPEKPVYAQAPLDVNTKLGQLTPVKAYQNYSLFVGLNENGDIQIVAAAKDTNTTTLTNTIQTAEAKDSAADIEKALDTAKIYKVYPETTGRYKK